MAKSCSGLAENFNNTYCAIEKLETLERMINYEKNRLSKSKSVISAKETPVF